AINRPEAILLWYDPTAHPVQARHQESGEGQIWVAGWIRRAELDPLGLWIIRVHGDTHGSRAVALREDQVYGRLIAWNQAAITVGPRSTQCKHCGRMGQQAADEAARHLGEASIALGLGKEWLLALPEAHVDVHAGAIIAENRLGHKCDRFAGCARGVLYDVLVEHDLVGHTQK